ncbi:toll/interleukin-1 receptor domain-containing protein [Clostridium sp. AM58-1XD]|uniref:toll/interleukin-1 receptor domain-containing protein n=1 Tax=Clostridium sp. AM58-1XD TaxID=2292307 RepID=UPI0015F53734|nr:toll/interleukin-1 receptor domain-containing protein [Clostridium sp. AM58-1XD]
MSVLRCTMCGGELQVDTDLSVGKCEYCGSLISIPPNLERVGNLLNRANFLRQNNEFDKAAEIYEKILMENNRDAEAHYGLALCRYGIEYIKDPVTGRQIPTCHRTETISILDNSDFLQALSLADVLTRAVYQQAGEQIDEIQKKFLKIAREEQPYDIFICYKETAENGERTRDSVLAQEIYTELSKKYKVFFSRITLENRLGEEYESIIFTALNSARVMITVGTSTENYQSVWVKNEWSRYLEMSRKDSGKTIIPCIRDMSPYELPGELLAFQAQDMGKLGFMQDLCSGIDKLLGGGREKDSDIRIEADSQMARWAKNANTFLKLGEIGKAKKLYEELADEYPDYYGGWLGLARVVSGGFKNENETVAREVERYLIYAEKFASEEQKAEIAAVSGNYRERVEKRRIQNRLKEFLKQKAEADKNVALHSGGEISEIKEECIDTDEKIRNLKQKGQELKQQIEAQKKEREKKSKGIVLLVFLGFLFMALPLSVIEYIGVPLLLYCWVVGGSLMFIGIYRPTAIRRIEQMRTAELRKVQDEIKRLDEIRKN